MGGRAGGYVARGIARGLELQSERQERERREAIQRAAESREERRLRLYETEAEEARSERLRLRGREERERPTAFELQASEVEERQAQDEVTRLSSLLERTGGRNPAVVSSLEAAEAKLSDIRNRRAATIRGLAGAGGVTTAAPAPTIAAPAPGVPATPGAVAPTTAQPATSASLRASVAAEERGRESEAKIQPLIQQAIQTITDSDAANLPSRMSSTVEGIGLIVGGMLQRGEIGEGEAHRFMFRASTAIRSASIPLIQTNDSEEISRSFRTWAKTYFRQLPGADESDARDKAEGLAAQWARIHGGISRLPGISIHGPAFDADALRRRLIAIIPEAKRSAEEERATGLQRKVEETRLEAEAGRETPAQAAARAGAVAGAAARATAAVPQREGTSEFERNLDIIYGPSETPDKTEYRRQYLERFTGTRPSLTVQAARPVAENFKHDIIAQGGIGNFGINVLGLDKPSDQRNANQITAQRTWNDLPASERLRISAINPDSFNENLIGDVGLLTNIAVSWLNRQSSRGARDADTLREWRNIYQRAGASGNETLRRAMEASIEQFVPRGH